MTLNWGACEETNDIRNYLLLAVIKELLVFGSFQ